MQTKLQNPKKNLFSIFAVILIISMAIPITTLPTASAHTPPWDIVSYAYVTAAPNPVGVGQTVYVYMWVDTPPSGAGITNDIRRHDYTLTITHPDGTNKTQSWDIIDDTTGIQAYFFTPDTIGEYTLTFNYAGQTHTWSGQFNGDTYLPAQAVTKLTVQEEEIPGITPSAPLPTEYWSRPISGENTDWYAVSSNWLNGPYIRTGATATGGSGYGRYQPDGIGPETSHIMWTKEIQFGGVVGGTSTTNLGEGYYTGSSYNPRFSRAIVMHGILYYEEPWGNSGSGGDYVAVDLQTGEELWRIDPAATGTRLVPSFGYMPTYEDGNQHGVLPNGLLFATYSIGGTPTPYGMMGGTPCWAAYDARTGKLTGFNLTNVPSGSAASATLAANSANGASVAGPVGEYVIYSLTNIGTTSNPSYYLSQWNSSKYQQLSPGQIGAGNWYPTGSFDATDRRMYDWNVSLPWLSGQGWTIYRDVIYGDKLLFMQGSLGTGPRTQGTGATITAVSINADNAGTKLWSKYYSPASGNVTRVIVAVDPIANTFVTEDKETLELNGFSLNNGNHIWTAKTPIVEWDTLRRTTLSAYGNLYAAGYDGAVYCFDDATGNLVWSYGKGGEGNSTYAGANTVYSHYPVFIDVIADGKVYVGTTEHSPDQPLYKDAQYRCLNATTGEEIWTITGMGTGMYVGQYDIVADGYFVYLNIYDMQIYTIGKGASKLTVDAPLAAVSEGQSLIIRGTVTDIATGTTQKEQAARFPNGVPCVSDESQSAWMEYVYMQQPKPIDATGVDVSIAVIDANNNYRIIGTAVSDASGTYSLNWTPDIPGKYTVIATFDGNNAYYGSSAQTYFAVDEVEATPAPTETPPSVADQYFIPAIAGIFVLIIIVLVLLVIMMFKKKE
ncbi:MAG: PQQ-binding-like beta-propeller repeat protein [Candidatus Bathyarchaeota archaeon]|nr:PQQ-binding-like beta-propeller repeat protein [Candidatus Bathyarchaeota archaeon]